VSANQRLKLYYPVGTLAEPVVVEGDDAVLGTFVLTNGPTVVGTPDRYGNNLEPNTGTQGNNAPNAPNVDYAITAIFQPSAMVGPASAPSEEVFGFFYNKEVAGTVAIEGVFPFDTDGPVSPGAFLHTASPVPATSAPITIVNAGTYEVVWTTGVAEPQQVALFLDGVAVDSTIYGQATGTSVMTGVAVITATAGQALTLRNHSSAAALTLVTPAGGTQDNNTNSLFIKSLGLVGAGAAGVPGVVTLTFQNAVTHAPVDDPATVDEVEVVVRIQGMDTGSVAGTLYVQKQHSIES